MRYLCALLVAILLCVPMCADIVTMPLGGGVYADGFFSFSGGNGSTRFTAQDLILPSSYSEFWDYQCLGGPSCPYEVIESSGSYGPNVIPTPDSIVYTDAQGDTLTGAFTDGAFSYYYPSTDIFYNITFGGDFTLYGDGLVATGSVCFQDYFAGAMLGPQVRTCS